MTKRILLIDYESHSAERARGVLREPDYEIVAAHDGEEALNTFSSSRFDLVLLSGMLPRLPSAEVIREIRRKGGAAAPPILLMVSGYKGSNTKADAQRVGAFDLLPRPFSDDALRQAATEAIAAAGVAAKAPRGETNARGALGSDFIGHLLRHPRGSGPGVARGPRRLPESHRTRTWRSRSGFGTRSRASFPKPASAPSQVPGEVVDGHRGRAPALPDASGPQDSDPARRDAGPAAAAPGAAPSRPRRPPEPALAEDVSGPDRFGQYEILERIASGGMAELFRARRSGVEGFQKIVAIKKILPHIAGDEEFITMFADEAKLAAQLSHPNIVHIFDLGKIEGRRLLHRDGARGGARPAVHPSPGPGNGLADARCRSRSRSPRRWRPRSTTRTGAAATTGRTFTSSTATFPRRTSSSRPTATSSSATSGSPRPLPRSRGPNRAP